METLSIRFYLKKERILKDGTSPIFARITYCGQRTAFAINRSIKAEHWDPDLRQPRGKKESDKELMAFLKELEFRFYKSERQIRESGAELSAQTLKLMVQGVDIRTKTFLYAFEKHNEEFEKLVESGSKAAATLQKYKAIKEHVEAFIKQKYKKDDVKLPHLNLAFLKSFDTYLRTDGSLSGNTTVKYCRLLKRISNYALENAWIHRDPFFGYKGVVKERPMNYLTMTELKKVMNMKTDLIRLGAVRDCFVFACFTGLSYSDMLDLTKDNIELDEDGKEWIVTHRRKTGNRCKIPLLKPAKDIIEKNECHPRKKEGCLLPVISNQKYNAYLKEIADICGLDKTLSSHCGRHTFGTTVTLSLGVPMETVSALLGHSSILQTKTYARLLDEKLSEDTDHLRDLFNNLKK